MDELTLFVTLRNWGPMREETSSIILMADERLWCSSVFMWRAKCGNSIGTLLSRLMEKKVGGENANTGFSSVHDLEES